MLTSVAISAMVIVDQVCLVRTWCRDEEADEFVKAIVASVALPLIETSGNHSGWPRVHSKGSGMLS